MFLRQRQQSYLTELLHHAWATGQASCLFSSVSYTQRAGTKKKKKIQGSMAAEQGREGDGRVWMKENIWKKLTAQNRAQYTRCLIILTSLPPS